MQSIMNHNCDSYLGVEGIDEVESESVEEELVVADARGLILLLKDLVVVDAELKVGCTVPKFFNKLIFDYS